MLQGRRRTRPDTYLFFFFGFAFILFLTHAPYLQLPFYWDELGQFVPAALDIYRFGAWIPRTTVPNVHPPGVMAYLAGFWMLADFSVDSTRIAMLLLASAALLVTFLLAIELARGIDGAPAFTATVLLCICPLFFAQAMMAQLDMPAMLLTSLALLLFVQNRIVPAALVCLPLVLVKETAAMVPALFAFWLWRENRRREAVLFLPPFAVLAAWLLSLKLSTGHLLGNQEFADYNLLYPLHPLRVAVALCRRLYFLLFENFHWIGAAAVWFAWRSGKLFRTRAWRISGVLVALHVVVLSVAGGAVLERYLLPVLPVVYCAMAVALVRRRALLAALALGLAAGNFWNPPYPSPPENNLAFTDAVRLHAAAARYLERFYPDRIIATAWPLSAALSRPDYGYVHARLRVRRVTDFMPRSVAKLEPSVPGVFVLYSRDTEPSWGPFHLRWFEYLRRRYYGYEPPVTGPEVEARFSMRRLARWERSGQWVEIYVRDRAVPSPSTSAAVSLLLPVPSSPADLHWEPFTQYGNILQETRFFLP